MSEKGAMKITISELEKAINITLNHIKELGYEEVELDFDLYWDVDADERYKVDEQPKDISIGKLSDDWEWVHNYITGKTKPITYGLVWCGQVMRAIGEKIKE